MADTPTDNPDTQAITEIRAAIERNGAGGDTTVAATDILYRLKELGWANPG